MRGPLRKLLIAVVTVLVLLLGAEGVLRLLFKATRSAKMADAEIEEHLGQGYRYDPDLYWYWATLPDSGAQVNAFGFRRVEPMQAPKPEGVTRVITLGDSQTFGGGVMAEDTYTTYAQASLGPAWEVLNAGISGYRSLNVYRLLRLRLAAFEPDVLVVDCMPKDSPREDGPLVARPLGGGRLDEMLWNSRLYYFSQLLLRIAHLRPWETLPWPLQLHEVREKLIDPKQGDLRQSPDMGNHDLIGRWAEERGISAVFMRYPYNHDGVKVGCHAWEGSDPEGFPIFDACAVLSASGHPADALFFDKNHLRPLGNQIVGQALAEMLRGMGG